MASLPAGPYILQYHIVTEGFSHDCELNCDTIGEAIAGQEPGDVQLAARSGSATISLAEGANDFWAVYRALLPTTAECSAYTLWKAQPNTTKRLFVSGGILETPNGSNGALIPAQQVTLTFRSASGRIGRIVAMDASIAGNSRTPLTPGVGTFPPNVLAGYVLSGDSIVCARDRSYFVQALNLSLGQNEATFKDRYRS